MAQVEIARFPDLYEAELAAAFLQSHAIDAVVADRHLSTIDPLMQRALGGLRLMVPDRQAAEATSLLARANAGEFATDEGDDIAKSQGSVGLSAAVLAATALTGGMGGLAASGLRGPLRPARIAGLVLIGAIVVGSLAVLAATVWFGG